MLSFKNYISESSKVTALKHLYHPEELIYLEGHSGVNTAIEFLRQTLVALHSKDSNIKVSRKIDGAPSCVFGHIDGKFFVGSKSVFNANPKINYTEKDIEQNHSESPGLAAKLRIALEYLPKVVPNNNIIYQGDFLFDDDIKKSNKINGEESYVFRPNTITYAVEKSSDLGKSIGIAKMGIVIHTYYMGLSDSAKFLPDLSKFKHHKDVFFTGAKVELGDKFLLSDELSATISGLIVQLQKTNDFLESKKFYSAITPIVATVITKFHNKLVREGTTISPEKTYKEFVEYFTEELKKDVNKVKTDAAKNRKLAALQNELDILEKNKDGFILSLKMYALMLEVKTILVNQFNSVKMFGTFIGNDGGFVPTNDEGFVVIGDGNVIKLVDRFEFSRINFNLVKDW